MSLSIRSVWTKSFHRALVMSVDIVCVLVVLYKCLDLMVFGYLMFNVCRSCFLWKLSMLFSSVVDIPHVPQFHNRID